MSQSCGKIRWADLAEEADDVDEIDAAYPESKGSPASEGNLKSEQDRAEKMERCGCRNHSGPRPTFHRLDLMEANQAGYHFWCCKICYEALFENGEAMSSKKWKKMARRTQCQTPYNSKHLLTKTGRRGRYAAYFFKHQSVIAAECQEWGIEQASLATWLEMCDLAF